MKATNFGRHALALGSTLMIAAACGEKSNDSGNSQAPAGPANTQSSVELQGEWQSNCLNPSLTGLGERSTLLFNGQDFTRTSQISGPGGCNSNDVEAQIKGTYVRGPMIRQGVHQIDLTTANATITPRSEAGRLLLVLAKACGISDWKLGEAKDITAALGTESCFETYPKQTYQIYSIEGNQLFFGSGEDFSTVGKRPVELERNYIYTKR
jgi:hypothetical protein